VARLRYYCFDYMMLKLDGLMCELIRAESSDGSAILLMTCVVLFCSRRVYYCGINVFLLSLWEDFIEERLICCVSGFIGTIFRGDLSRLDSKGAESSPCDSGGVYILVSRDMKANMAVAKEFWLMGFEVGWVENEPLE